MPGSSSVKASWRGLVFLSSPAESRSRVEFFAFTTLPFLLSQCQPPLCCSSPILFVGCLLVRVSLSQTAPLLLPLEERTDQVRYVFLKFDKGDSERGHNAPGGRSRDFYRESKAVTRATSSPSVDRSLMTLTLPAATGALAGWNDGQG